MTSYDDLARVDVSSWRAVREEPVGAEEKWWLAAPDEVRWLFKPVRVRDNGTRLGMDWAEAIAARLAGLIGLPHAEVELAVRDGVDGVVSKLVVPDGFALRGGSDQLLDTGAFGFRTFEERTKAERKTRPGHSLANIRSALSAVDAPSGSPAGLDAFDVFTGYLVLDAWIANPDRHEQNWAVLEPDTGATARRVLSPTFDHASSLGYGLTEVQRTETADDAMKLRRFAEGGLARRFENTGPETIPTLVTLARDAIDIASSTGRRHWTAVATALPVDAARTVVERVPGLSVGTRRFIIRLVEENARRIRRECDRTA
ncbi:MULTISPECIES: HipA domain-containing protein [Cellulosimicrobium]|uniref:HipA domain-containing protein n=1 Tax=Cellulosimicrobium TaxID=157920 RepID=UPI0011A346B2|nr:HipA domain-containing protein [Cellulosimicrobium sp. TH-20]